MLLTKRYLSKMLTSQEFLLLEHCLERLKLNYKSLFWFCDDLMVHNQMQLYASPEKVFSKQEISAILKAEGFLNIAPVYVREELRVFCHA